MKFKVWSDTNMVNACTRLEEEGFSFVADTVNNIITVTKDLAEAKAVIKEEGGEEIG